MLQPSFAKRFDEAEQAGDPTLMDPRITHYLATFPFATGIEQGAPSVEPLYAAWLTDFPGCISQGQSPDEAIERLMALAPAFLERMVALGVEIPSEVPAIATGWIRFYAADGSLVTLGGQSPREIEAGPADKAETQTATPSATAA